MGDGLFYSSRNPRSFQRMKMRTRKTIPKTPRVMAVFEESPPAVGVVPVELDTTTGTSGVSVVGCTVGVVGVVVATGVVVTGGGGGGGQSNGQLRYVSPTFSSHVVSSSQNELPFTEISKRCFPPLV